MTEGKSIHDRRFGVGSPVEVSENARHRAKARSVIELSAEYGTAARHAPLSGWAACVIARREMIRVGRLGDRRISMISRPKARNVHQFISNLPRYSVAPADLPGWVFGRDESSWKGNGVDDVEHDR